MQARTRTFSFIGASLYGNRGAEAMQVTSIAMIRRRFPECRINIFSYLPKEDTHLLKENPDKNIRVYSATPYSLVIMLFPLALIARFLIWLRVPSLTRKLPFGIGAIAASDGFIDLSGVSFMLGRSKFLSYNLLTHLPPLLCKVPLFKLSQAMGPFSGRFVGLASDLILPRCTLIVSRGESTCHHLVSRYGKRIRHRTAADIAFLFEDSFSLTKEGSLETFKLLKRLQAMRSTGSCFIGICPSAVVYKKFSSLDQDYIGFLIRMISALKNNGYQIVIFPNATRVKSPESAFNNDFFVLLKLKKQMGRAASEIHWVDWDVNTSSIRAIIRNMNACIVSRFHAMVAALSENVPTAVFSWSHKYLEVMSTFQMENFVYDYSNIEKFSEDDFCNVATKLLSVHRTKIEDSLREVRISAESQFDALAEAIANRSEAFSEQAITAKP